MSANAAEQSERAVKGKTAMEERVCLVGLDEAEVEEIRERVGAGVGIVAHQALPRMAVQGGELRVESRRGPALVPVSKIVFHSIYEHDLDFICGLALWGGPCLPDARAMMNCRLKFPCLIRALQHTRFGAPMRGYAGPNAPYNGEGEHVAKWGNWHCGENKARFGQSWESADACIIEDFLPGQAVRVVLIGEQHWQIRLEGRDWLKSIHDSQAQFMDVNADLLADTRTVGKAFGLEIVANDYIITPDGTPHLLEVNHIPNVTRFPAIWEAYRDYTVAWIGSGG